MLICLCLCVYFCVAAIVFVCGFFQCSCLRLLFLLIGWFVLFCLAVCLSVLLAFFPLLQFCDCLVVFAVCVCGLCLCLCYRFCIGCCCAFVCMRSVLLCLLCCTVHRVVLVLCVFCLFVVMLFVSVDVEVSLVLFLVWLSCGRFGFVLFPLVL